MIFITFAWFLSHDGCPLSSASVLHFYKPMNCCGLQLATGFVFGWQQGPLYLSGFDWLDLSYPVLFWQEICSDL